jgi:hypothetical protein
MIVVTFVLALVAGFITLQVLTKTLRVLWGCLSRLELLLASRSRWLSCSSSGGSDACRCTPHLQGWHLTSGGPAGATAASAAADQGGHPAAGDPATNRSKRRRFVARSPLNASDAGVAGEVEYAGPIAAAPAGEFERIMAMHRLPCPLTDTPLSATQAASSHPSDRPRRERGRV